MEIEQLEEIEHKLFGVFGRVWIYDRAVWIEDSYAELDGDEDGEASWRAVREINNDLRELGLKLIYPDYTDKAVCGQVVPLESEK